ncbi:MAG: TolC family protein [Bacteroidia bacterium]|nr:TolC family protein [Bacteroidia bacterium]
MKKMLWNMARVCALPPLRRGGQGGETSARRSRTRQLAAALALCLSGCAMPLAAQPAGPLRLEDALSIGLESSYGIRIARQTEALAEVSNTPGAAGMLPTAAFAATQSLATNNTQLKFFSGDERSVNGATTVNFNANVQLNWTLFDGMAMFVRRDRLAESAALQSVQTQREVAAAAYGITLAFYNVVIQQELYRVLEQNLTLSADRRQLAAGRLRVGAGSELALLQARVDFNTDSSALLRQELALTQSKARLNRLLLYDPGAPLEVQPGVPLDQTLSLDTLEAEIMSQNPELLAARANIRLSELAVREARADLLPSLNLNATLNFTRFTTEAGVLQSNRSYGPSAALVLSYPIFSAGARRRAIEGAAIGAEQASLRYESLRADLQSDLYLQYEAYRAALELIAIEAASLEIARSNAAITAGKYRLGAANELEVRQAQVNLVAAENRLLSARYTAKLAETDLRFLAGQLRVD